MPEKLDTKELMLPLEMLKEQLEFLESYYEDDRFENKQEAEKLITKFKDSIEILERNEIKWELLN